jgi:hypothetical protein
MNCARSSRAALFPAVIAPVWYFQGPLTIRPYVISLNKQIYVFIWLCYPCTIWEAMLIQRFCHEHKVNFSNRQIVLSWRKLHKGLFRFPKTFLPYQTNFRDKHHVLRRVLSVQSRLRNLSQCAVFGCTDRFELFSQGFALNTKDVFGEKVTAVG